MSVYPNRNWGLILQQVWTMILKDRIRTGGDYSRGHSNGNKSRKEACKRFNKGKCTAGYHAGMAIDV